MTKRKSITIPNRTAFHSQQSAPPLDQQRLIAEQTEAFLAGGGKIQSIPCGVSGQSMYPPSNTTKI